MTSHNDQKITRQIKTFDPTNEADLYDLWRALDKRFRKRELAIALWVNGEEYEHFYVHQIDITGMRKDIAIALLNKRRGSEKPEDIEDRKRVVAILEGEKAEWFDPEITPVPLACWISPGDFLLSKWTRRKSVSIQNNGEISVRAEICGQLTYNDLITHDWDTYLVLRWEKKQHELQAVS